MHRVPCRHHEHAEPGPDGAGDHARRGGTFLTGVRMKKSATDVRAGVSIDQVIADGYPRATLLADPAFASLRESLAL